jgi:CubicO group peptidase (beta-lactamase class C family)
MMVSPTLASLLFAGALGSAPTIDHSAAVKRLDRTLSQLTREDRFAGCVVVLHRDKVLFARPYGFADRALGVRHTLANKYRFHSISKWFTGATMSALMEEGKLRPDDPVSKYIPEWPANLASVRVENLLTHTSGIPWSTNDWGARYRVSPSVTLAALIKEVPIAAPVNAPQPWAYNNTNFEIAATVAEAATRTRFSEELHRRILQRIGLRDTVLALPVSATPLSGDRLVLGLATGYNGQPTLPVDTVVRSSAIPASGGLIGTGRDLAQFGRAFTTGKLLPDAAFRRMIEGVAVPESPNRYGYGVVVGVKEGRRFFRHDGGNNGGIAWLEVFPDDGVVIAAASNLGYADPMALRNLYKDIFPKATP